MLFLGADHRGFQLKERLKEYLRTRGTVFEDMGAREYNSDDDYPDYAQKVAQAIGKNPDAHRGIVLCGSGVGVAIAVDKGKGMRAGLFFNVKQAQDATAHDHVNVAALPADFLTAEEAAAIVEVFLNTPYAQEERHVRRIGKINEIEMTNS